MANLYKPTFLQPQNVEIDMANNQMFSCQVNGTVITTYRIKLYRVDTSALLYDTTTITLPSPLYDKDILTHTISGGTITYRGQIKWTIEVGNGTSTLTSSETPFWNWSDPVYTMTVPATITTKSYQFTAAYSQAQSISILKFKFIWYDDNDVILQDAGWIYSADTKYTFDGFITGNDYKVESIAVDEYNYSVSTGKQTFTVLYPAPAVLMTPDAVQYDATSFVDVNWSKAVSIPGYTTGTYQFVDDFLVPGNHGLHLDSGSTIYWNVDIPIDFTGTFVLQLAPMWDTDVSYDQNAKVVFNEQIYISLTNGNMGNFPDLSPTDWVQNNFDGLICQLHGTSQLYQVGYTIDSFYFAINGVQFDLKYLPITINPFLVAMRPTRIYVKYWEVFNTWEKISNITWQQAILKTWEEIKYQ